MAERFNNEICGTLQVRLEERLYKRMLVTNSKKNYILCRTCGTMTPLGTEGKIMEISEFQPIIIITIWDAWSLL
jgi:hypothetical protein